MGFVELRFKLVDLHGQGTVGGDETGGFILGQCGTEFQVDRHHRITFLKGSPEGDPFRRRPACKGGVVQFGLLQCKAFSFTLKTPLHRQLDQKSLPLGVSARLFGEFHLGHHIVFHDPVIPQNDFASFIEEYPVGTDLDLAFGQTQFLAD